MSDKERFSLYKHYECLMSRLMRYSSGCKYEKDSLEDVYAKMINDEISSFVYVQDKRVMDMTFNNIVKSIKNKYLSYVNEVLRRENIDIKYDFNYDCSFDSIVKQASDALVTDEKKKDASNNIINRLNDVIKDNEISEWISLYIEKIKLQANKFNSLSEYYENEKVIDEMLEELKEMFNKHNVYSNKAKDIEEFLGEYAPKGLKNYLEEFKKAVWEGRFVWADSILITKDFLLTRFRTIKYEVNCALEIINQNYNTRLKNVKSQEKIDLVNKIYSFVMDVIQNVLQGVEDRNILNTLQQISFKNIDEIYELVSYKTKSLYINVDANKELIEDELLVLIDSDDKYLYCFSYPSFKMIKLSKRYFSKKYANVYSLYGKKRKFDDKFIDILKEIAIPVVYQLDDLSVVGSINRIVEFIDEERKSFDRDNQNDMSLKRKK